MNRPTVCRREIVSWRYQRACMTVKPGASEATGATTAVSPVRTATMRRVVAVTSRSPAEAASLLRGDGQRRGRSPHQDDEPHPDDRGDPGAQHRPEAGVMGTVGEEDERRPETDPRQDRQEQCGAGSLGAPLIPLGRDQRGGEHGQARSGKGQRRGALPDDQAPRHREDGADDGRRRGDLSDLADGQALEEASQGHHVEQPGTGAQEHGVRREGAAPDEGDDQRADECRQLRPGQDGQGVVAARRESAQEVPAPERGRDQQADEDGHVSATTCGAVGEGAIVPHARPARPSQPCGGGASCQNCSGTRPSSRAVRAWSFSSGGIWLV